MTYEAFTTALTRVLEYDGKSAEGVELAAYELFEKGFFEL
jgi:hypothetical protein